MSRWMELADANDFAAIANLNVEAYREFASCMTPEAWNAMEANLRAIEARSQAAQFLVVRAFGGLVGSVAYCPARMGPAPTIPETWASILLVAVSPAYRGRGIARDLAQACIRRARADGARVVGLFTSELMIGAQRLYVSLGFRREAELPVRYGLRYWRYRLDLDPSAQH